MGISDAVIVAFDQSVALISRLDILPLPRPGRLRFTDPTFAFPHRYFANEPFADFHRVEGVRGVYIATLINGSFSEENMRSVITFDKGGTWELLQPPSQTRYGERIDCEVVQGREKHPLEEAGTQTRWESIPPSGDSRTRWDEGTGWRVNALCFAFLVLPGLLSPPSPAPEPAAEFPASQDAHSVQGVSTRPDHRHRYCSHAGAWGAVLLGHEELGSI